MIDQIFQDLIDSIHFGSSARPWWLRLLINLGFVAMLFGLVLLFVWFAAPDTKIGRLGGTELKGAAKQPMEVGVQDQRGIMDSTSHPIQPPDGIAIEIHPKDVR